MDEPRSDTFSKLFIERASALKRYVRRLVHSGETAEEIVQEAFLRAYQHADNDRPPGALLYSIARNLAVDHHRHQQASPIETVADEFCSALKPDIEVESLESWIVIQEQSALLKRAVQMLPPQCRAAFALKVFNCCSYREIAGQLGIAEKTVEAHISRGMRETFRFMRKHYQLGDQG